MLETIRIRRAHYDDAAIITAQRTAMFAEMGYEADPAEADEINTGMLMWTQNMIEGGEYLGWLLVDEATEKVVGGAGVWMMRWCPRPDEAGGKRAYVMNVYVEPDYRQQGLARLLLNTILEYCRRHHVSVVSLHASKMGRPLYETLGFNASNEMRLKLS